MKKKLLGLLLMVFCTSIVSAQEEKGVFVEGSVSLASDRLGKYFASDFFIVTPGIGYQFNEKLSVGFKVGLSNDKSTFACLTILRILTFVTIFFFQKLRILKIF